MGGWLGKSLKHKLSLLVIIAVMVPLLSLGLFSYKIAERLTEEKAKISGMNTLRQLETYMENMVNDAENMSLFLIGSSEVQNYLKTPDSDLLKQTSIIGFLTNLAFSKAYIANIVIEPINGKDPISSKSINSTGFVDITETDFNYYSTHANWWSSVYSQWTSVGVQKVITMARPIRSTDKYKEIGKLRISLNQGMIAKHIRQSALERTGFVLLLDENNRIMAGPEEFRTNQLITETYPGMGSLNGNNGYLNYGEGADMKTVLYDEISSTQWKLVGIIPSEEYRSQNRYFLMLTAAAVGVALLLVIALVVFLIQRVTNPLSALTRILKKASPEALPSIPVTSIDEVGELIVSYNRLSSRIVNLTDEVKRNEAMKQQTDMIALQAQINPHFLYNTLSSVHWLALMSKESRIAEMVGALSDFLRFSLNKGEEYCAVEQELAHANRYAHIQSIRYPDKFDVHVDADPELAQSYMLKLVLQPLIENAMIHGILKREGKGRISVWVRREGMNMKFGVEDDGIGIAKEQLAKLMELLAVSEIVQRESSSAAESYGLRNVHKRLLLHYGSGAGLHIISTVGQGTSVTFTIPSLSPDDRKQEVGGYFNAEADAGSIEHTGSGAR
ncbi:sensor histidine kinase [Cohnella sp.]|uniref:sensor histidine kinase n=1 Tax=Cohnella sp. TaxID=1883426 RepID=UPI003567E1B5